MFPTSIQDSNPASRTLTKKKLPQDSCLEHAAFFSSHSTGSSAQSRARIYFHSKSLAFSLFKSDDFFCVFFRRMNFNGWAENDDNFYVCFSIWRSSSLFYCSKWTWWREITFLTFSSLGSSLKFALKSISSFLSLCFRHESFPVCHFKGCEGRWMKSWMKCFWI